MNKGLTVTGPTSSTRGTMGAVSRRAAGAVLYTLGILGVWQLLVVTFDIPPFILPSPIDVGAEVVRNGAVLVHHFRVTALEVLIGFVIAAAVGIPLACLIAASRAARLLVYPLVVATQSVPKIAVAPLFIIWLGFGVEPKILMTVLICFFPIVLDTLVGLDSMQKEIGLLTKSMGARPLDVFMKVRLPSALPNIFAGLKIASSLAVVGAVAAEFVGADIGLGYLLVSAAGQLNTALVFGIIVVLSVFGAAIYYLVEIIEKRALRGHRTSHVG